jgi:hypothetical protein
MNLNNCVIKKINEDDILEILLEHFQEINAKDLSSSQCVLLGQPGVNLRFLAVYGNGDSNGRLNFDLEEIDKNYDFNGDHSFLEKNPSFVIAKDSVISFKKKSRYWRKSRYRYKYSPKRG